MPRVWPAPGHMRAEMVTSLLVRIARAQVTRRRHRRSGRLCSTMPCCRPICCFRHSASMLPLPPPQQQKVRASHVSDGHLHCHIRLDADRGDLQAGLWVWVRVCAVAGGRVGWGCRAWQKGRSKVPLLLPVTRYLPGVEVHVPAGQSAMPWCPSHTRANLAGASPLRSAPALPHQRCSPPSIRDAPSISHTHTHAHARGRVRTHAYLHPTCFTTSAGDCRSIRRLCTLRRQQRSRSLCQLPRGR